MFNLLIEQEPEAVVRPRSAEETATLVRATTELGLRIAPQGSGHNAAPLGSLEGTVLFRLERMVAVELHAGERRARVEAGARWWDITPQASMQGLAALHGSSPEINVTGYSLGGGSGCGAGDRAARRAGASPYGERPLRSPRTWAVASPRRRPRPR